MRGSPYLPLALISISFFALGVAPPTASARTNIAGPGTGISGLPQSCKIETLDPLGKPLGICSGTLTGQREITTAAHCVQGRDGRYGELAYRIACGFQRVEKTLDAKTGRPNRMTYFDHIRVVSAGEAHADVRYDRAPGVLARYDLARIQLPVAIPITPIPTISANAFRKLQATHPRLEYRIEGFGVADDLDTGVLHHATIQPTEVSETSLYVEEEWSRAEAGRSIARLLTEWKRIAFAFWNKSGSAYVAERSERYGTAQMLGGDSGGGVFVRESTDHEWKLVAVHSGIRALLRAEFPDSFGEDTVCGHTPECDGFRVLSRADRARITVRNECSLVPDAWKLDARARSAP